MSVKRDGHRNSLPRAEGAPKRMKKFGIGLGIAMANRNRLLKVSNFDSQGGLGRGLGQFSFELAH